MKILIAGLVKSEQLERLKQEGGPRGHTIDGCYVAELVIESNKHEFRATLRGRDLSEFDLIYIWSVGKRRWEWYTAVHWLNKNYGTIIVNKKVIDSDYLYYLSPAMDYLKQTENGINFPKSAIIFSHQSIESVVDGFQFPLILKTSAGRQGRGVFRVESVEELATQMKELKDISPSFVIREFIPNNGDVRIFTVGYKAIGAMKRTPVVPGEFRSNISQGGEGSNFDLRSNPNVQEIAERLSKLTRTEIAGVDIMLHIDTKEPYVLEINPGPQFKGLEQYTDTNAALEIVKYFEVLQESKALGSRDE